MRHHLRVTVGAERVRAELVARATVPWSAEWTYDGPEQLASVIAALRDRPAEARARMVHVFFERPIVQVRTLHGLPRTGARALRALVAAQPQRYFRRTSGALVIDAGWATSVPTRERVARAVGIERIWLDAVERGAQLAGLRVVRLAPALADTRLAFPRQAHDGWLRALRAVPQAWLWAHVVGIWALGAGIDFVRSERALRRLDAEWRTLAAPLAAARRARSQADSVRDMAEAVDRDETSRGATTAGMHRIVLALPDSAYLTSLELDTHGRGTITGFAWRATEVVVALERAKAIRRPRLQGSSPREVNAGHEWERFTIVYGDGPR